MPYNRSEIMKAAWAIFRETYTFAGRCEFDRANFAWALSEAWRQAKEARRMAAIPAARRAAQIAAIDSRIENLTYATFRTNSAAVLRGLESERAALAA